MPQTPLLTPPPPTTPIQNAYRPNDERDTATKIMDFARGFFGTKPGLTDMNSSTATAAGDAFGQLNPIHMVGPMMGMTKFITKNLNTGERLVNTASREKSTAHALWQLAEYLKSSGADPTDATKTLEIAKKYPRVLAHIEHIEDMDNPNVFGAQSNSLAPGISQLHLNKNLPNMSSVSPVADTFAHELQHVGQNLRDPSFPMSYELESAEKGYQNNPYEIAANKGAAKRTSPIQGKTFLERISPTDVKARYQMAPKPTLSEVFSKSPKVINEYYKELNTPLNIKQQLLDSLEKLKKNKGK